MGSIVQAYKTRLFTKWAKKSGIRDVDLLKSVREIQDGLTGASLGANLIKQRVSVGGRGKRGGARVILAYKKADKIFFLFGFEKNEKENISNKEHEALREVGNSLLTATKRKLLELQNMGQIIQLGGN